MKDNLQRLLPAIEREIREAKNRAERRQLEKRQKEAEKERIAHLRSFESMDKINRALQGTNELKQMMRSVLKVVQNIFDSERAYLLYPCDPDSPTWTVPMECYKPEYPGVFEKKLEMKTEKDIADKFRVLLDSDRPLKFGPKADFSLPGKAAKRFNFKSIVAMAIYPKTGKPWEFGLHQCSYARVWTDEEVRLFQEIGRRLGDALTSLLSYQQVTESEEKYRLIAENTADVINVFDLDLNSKFVSPSIKNLRGYSVEEVMNQSLKQILTPESYKKVKEVIKHQLFLENDKTADLDRSVILELEEYHKDGHTIWVELAASFIRDKEMKATGVLTITRNITKRKKAELELIESERKFRSLAESIPDNIIRYDKDMKLVYMNQNMLNATNVDFKPFIGTKRTDQIRDLTPPDYMSKLKTVLKTGEQQELEMEINNPAGENRIHNIRFVSEKDSKGNIVGALAIGRDVTERKKVEESLRILSQAIEQSPISIVITDTNGIIEYINPRFTEVTGYSKEEAVGENPSILKSGKMTKKFYKNLWDTITQDRIWKGEFQNKKKNGELYFEMASISPIKNREGKITHYVAVKEDITDRRQLEEQLRQSQKMEAIGQLAGGVAHDFNNMLGVIIGYSELVLMKVDETQEIFADLLEIRKAADRSADLTRQLLTFARKQTVVLKILNLNSTVEGMLKMLKRLISEQIKLKWVPQPDLWDIRLDPTQVDQILANLCVNARDSIKDVGEITISTRNMNVDYNYASQHPGLMPGEYVVLSVNDTGSGMDKITLDRIFEPFYTTKDTGKGTGLGLSTIYGIVKQNRGHIDVSSAPGKGTTFNIFIPRYIRKEKKETEEKKTTKIVKSNETILLVEDEKAILEMTNQMLTGLGYRVISTSSPNEAISIAEKYNAKIDLLLTDVILPEMNGKDLAEKLTAMYPSIKCLFMSGYSGEHIPQDEDLNFIQKPFSVAEITQKIRESLMN